VSFWPPAPGWWLLAVLLLAALVFAGVLLFRRWQRQQKLTMALREIQHVHKLYATWQQSTQGDAGQAGLALLQGCNSVLKRVALVHYPEQEVASLNGRAWLQFLDRTGNTDTFSNGSGRVLGDGGYRPSFLADEATAAALVQLVQNWITRQYRSPPEKPAAPAAATADADTAVAPAAKTAAAPVEAQA
jgi:hypothetical protein